MPIGVIVNALSIVIGGLMGAVIGKRLPENFKVKMNMVFGACAMAMGVKAIVLMENMPAVIFSVIIGTALGLALHLEAKINKASAGMQRTISRVMKSSGESVLDSESMDTLVTVIVLFCASGTGIYGTLISGMSGDHSVLITKSILDFFTAMIFACVLGVVIAAIAIPQCLIFLALFLLAGAIYPLTTKVMISDFQACGGIIMLATGFRMIKVKMFPTADMIPAMLLVMPCSLLWTSYILPLLS